MLKNEKRKALFMKGFSINAGKKKFTAKNPTVGNLKKFLKFQRNFAKKKEFDEETIKDMSELLKSVFPELDDEAAEQMEASEFMKAANDMADWMGEALGDDEKKA